MDTIVFSLYMLFIVFVGLYASRKVKSFREFSMGSQNLTTFAIFATLSASFIGGGFSVGNASKVFEVGIGHIFALWGFSLKEILVSLYIAPKVGAHLNAVTVGDILGRAYGKSMKPFAGIAAFIFCGGLVGVQIQAIGASFQVFFGMAPLTGILIGVGIVILYSAISGIVGIVYTDIVQFLILAVLIPVTFTIGFVKVGGFEAISAASSVEHFKIINSDISLFTLGVLFLTYLFGETLVPPYVHRLLLSKNTENTRKGTLYSGLFSIPFFAIAGAIGLIALVVEPNLQDTSLALPTVVMTVLPVGLKGLAIASIIAVVMSSADSFLLSATLAFTQDLVAPVTEKMNKPLSEKVQLLLARLSLIMVGALGIVFAVNSASVINTLLLAYNFWAPVMLVPLGAAILLPEVKAAWGWAALIAGGMTTAIWQFILHNPFGMDGLLPGVFASFIAFFIAKLIVRK